MAISKNALLSSGLATFGIALALASGPYGIAFGAALVYSSLIALAMTAIIYGISEGNLNMRSNSRTPVTTHSRTFVPAGAPLPTVIVRPAPVVQTRGFVSAVVPPPVAHTRHFEPAQKPPVAHTRHFEPAQKPPVAHTRHFEPAQKPPVAHTRHFEPAVSAITPAFAAARTPSAPSAPSHLGTKVSSVFVPRKI